MDKQIRHSKQRDLILDFIKSTNQHPSADVIYEQIRKQLPNISLGTVYRNLKLLESLGQITIVKGHDNIEHFEIKHQEHAHLICTNCGCIIDIDLPNALQTKLVKLIKDKALVDKISLSYQGLCKNCQK